ncbi:MAG: hypothetical protein M3393_08840 [Actinomycetota bacterium]|nr:hypothetical protein [Actinomycetota bacterium]
MMVTLMLTLPLLAYVTGTLITSEAGMPAQRSPIVISDDNARQSPSDEPRRGGDRPADRQPPAVSPPSGVDPGAGDDGSDDASEDDAGPDDSGIDDGTGDDDGVRVVRPTPDYLGDDDEADNEADDGADDDGDGEADSDDDDSGDDTGDDD